LRELRGGIHIDSTREAGLTPAQARYLENAAIFKLHGYGDDDVPEVSDDLHGAKAHAETLTSAQMDRYLDALSDEQRAALAAGAVAMNEALANPVAVSA
jgi:hypothetical protein